MLEDVNICDCTILQQQLATEQHTCLNMTALVKWTKLQRGNYSYTYESINQLIIQHKGH